MEIPESTASRLLNSYLVLLVLAGEPVPNSLEEGRFVLRHGSFGSGGTTIINVLLLSRPRRCWINLLGGDEKAIARSAKWGTGDKGEHWFVGFIN